MKKIAFAFISLALLSGCKNTQNNTEQETETEVVELAPEYQYYGDSITVDNAVPANELLAKMEGNDSLQVKVEGIILSSCKMKGCWMKMDLGEEQMHVKFLDYDFFVPKNLDGEMAIVEGYAKIDTMSVAELKHLASDAEKSQEEIDAITEPEVNLSYVASGVIIKPKS